MDFGNIRSLGRIGLRRSRQSAALVVQKARRSLEAIRFVPPLALLFIN